MHIPFDQVVAAWLSAEWDYPCYEKQRKIIDHHIVHRPDFLNAAHNFLRRELLAYNRKGILKKLPENITWHKTHYTKNDIPRSRLINADWCVQISEGDRSLKNALRYEANLLKLAHLESLKKIQGIKSNPPSNTRLVFISHHPEGPLTCIEGNHRLIALASRSMFSPEDVIFPEVYIGISPDIDKLEI